MAYNTLTEDEKKVILERRTEFPFSGKYLNHTEKGLYVCKQCGSPLYRSENKFDSHCGWPSFDEAIDTNVRYMPDPDGIRMEIVCGECGGHLGHVFEGERFTPKNVRHCVNSISLDFIADVDSSSHKAYFACGCFWGAEHYFMNTPGVINTAVGFMGGHVNHPSYEQVCTQTTGHYETTEVTYDPKIISYENLVKLFFEIHDFSQFNGQGPDIGSQYRSCIFVANADERKVAEQCIHTLEDMNFNVATSVLPLSEFWKAEDYHQQYYKKTSGTPYCHHYRKIFP